MTRLKRWTGRLLGGLLAVAGGTGCKQQLFLEPADYDAALRSGPIARIESQPHGPILPPLVAGVAPATVLDPTRPPRFVALKECIALALEQGNVGIQAVNNPGQVNDQFSNFTGRGTTATDTLSAFALNPAIASAEVERSLSKFDARWVNSITWQKNDVATPIQFQAFLQNADVANLTSTLAKPLPTGGVAAVTFNVQYQSLTNPPPPGSAFAALPTSYTPQVQFTFEQPLLQAFGVEINQLLQAHPGSVLVQGLRPSGGQGSEGILITRLRVGEQRAEFDRQVNQLLLNVEAAYWNLYSAYYNLYAQEEALKQSQFAYLIFRERAFGGITREQSQYQALAQVELFRGQVLVARGQVLQAERQLRGMLGMRSDDGQRLVPADRPAEVSYSPEYYELANEAMQYRPELTIARQELKVQQLNLVLQRNLRRPDLRFISQYSLQGIGPRLDGRPEENALDSLMNNQFQSWTLGLRADIPIGFRDANASTRQAELALRQAYQYLIDSERKTLEFLTEQYRSVIQAHELIKFRRAQREALQKYLELDKQILVQGLLKTEEYIGFVTNLIQVQRDLANATASEFQAIAQYNIALAGLEFAKGTIQGYNNLTVTDGPVPAWVEKKAADHFAAREAGLKVREHPADSIPPLVKWNPDPALNRSPALIPGPAGTLPDGTPAAFPAVTAEPLPVPGGLVPAPGAGANPAVPAPNWVRPWDGSQPLPTPNPVPPAAPKPETAPAPKPVAPPAGKVADASPASVVFPQEGTVSLRKPPGAAALTAEPAAVPTAAPTRPVVPAMTVPAAPPAPLPSVAVPPVVIAPPAGLPTGASPVFSTPPGQ